MEMEMIMPAYYDSNIYVINKKIIIDTGMTADHVLPSLEKIVPLENIELIILTHTHYDHSGCAGAILEKSGAKLSIHEADAPFLSDDNLSGALNFGSRAACPFPDIVYSGGERIPIGRNSDGEDEYLEVIHTPGHTVGCICLYERNSKTLFSGDTVFSEGGIGRSDFKISAPEKMTDSIDKLTKLDIENLCPGHGRPTVGDANASIALSKMMSERLNP
ncbi:Hydroxyacylglutathione hydrolase [Methanimicrococcus sp. At1]|uniref:Hydroxyacylglutathione hydrolase n=1 Tax=Methanimicrococcus hacksteinii TaxID=3028293 RepID=A0ABU3VQV9_9EURY|nr:MBL fold metallo-hydrolase [Methanimicrococcus sp. At1]MDV0445800.1 Hydroxyacylglutathione hydrolase [Methanimicrococcus sp. At1]